MLALQSPGAALLQTMRDSCQEGIAGGDTHQSDREQKMGPYNLMAAELSTARLHKDATLATGSKKNTVKGRPIPCLPHQQLRQILVLSTLGQSWLLKSSPSQFSAPRAWVGAVLHLRRVQHHKSVQLHISAPWCQTGIMRAPESKCHHSSLTAVPLPTLLVSQLVGGEN